MSIDEATGCSAGASVSVPSGAWIGITPRGSCTFAVCRFSVRTPPPVYSPPFSSLLPPLPLQEKATLMSDRGAVGMVVVDYAASTGLVHMGGTVESSIRSVAVQFTDGQAMIDEILSPDNANHTLLVGVIGHAAPLPISLNNLLTTSSRLPPYPPFPHSSD